MLFDGSEENMEEKNDYMKEEVKLIKNLKPSLIPPLCYTIAFLGAVLAAILDIGELRLSKALYFLLLIVFVVLVVSSWYQYVMMYKNYRNAYKKMLKQFWEKTSTI